MLNYNCTDCVHLLLRVSRMSFKNFAFKSIMNSLYFSGSYLMLRPWSGGLGAILMLHHVCDSSDGEFAPNAHLTVSPKHLENTLQFLRRQKIDIVSMGEVVKRIANGQKSANAKPFVAITFDDGYRDNAEIAAPILRQYDAPYTIFVATGLIDGTADLWWDGLEAIIRKQDRLLIKISGAVEELDCANSDTKNQSYATLLDYLTTVFSEEEQRRWVKELAVLYKFDLEALRQNEMMSWEDLRHLAKDPLCTIGAHTIHHYALARLNEEQATKEIREGARILEAALGQKPEHFAYPYGYPAAAGTRDFGLTATLGFDSAVTTRPGVIYQDHNNHMTALPRISLNGHFQKNRYTKSLLSGLPTLLANKLRKLNVG